MRVPMRLVVVVVVVGSGCFDILHNGDVRFGRSVECIQNLYPEYISNNTRVFAQFYDSILKELADECG